MNEHELKIIGDKSVKSQEFPNHTYIKYVYSGHANTRAYRKLAGIPIQTESFFIPILDVLETIDIFNSLTFEKQLALCLNVSCELYDNPLRYLDKKYVKFYDIMGHFAWVPAKFAVAIIMNDNSNFGFMLHEIAKYPFKIHPELIDIYLNMISIS